MYGTHDSDEIRYLERDAWQTERASWEDEGEPVEVSRLVFTDLFRPGDCLGISFPNRLDIRIGTRAQAIRLV